MDSLVFSVIIPVYNVEPYLRPCLDSLLAQQDAPSWEAVIVDDGSTDGSGAICDEYAERHSGLFRVLHTPNGGVSLARNIGMDAAKGAYIAFLDADDLLEPEALAHLAPLLKTRPDMAYFYFQYFDGTSALKTPPPPPAFRDAETGDSYLRRCLGAGVMPPLGACFYAFSAGFLRGGGFRFPEGVAVSEDIDFTIGCLSCAVTVRGTDRVLYDYRMREGSATHTPSLEKVSMMCRTLAKWFRRYPCAPIADFYTMRALSLSKVGNLTETKELVAFFKENRDILDHVGRRNMKIARALFRIFGFYGGSAVANAVISLRNGRRARRRTNAT